MSVYSTPQYHPPALFQTTAVFVKERGRTKVLINVVYFILGSGNESKPRGLSRLLSNSFSTDYCLLWKWTQVPFPGPIGLHGCSQLYTSLPGCPIPLSDSLGTRHTHSIETYMWLNTYIHTHKIKKMKGITGGLLCNLEM